MTSHANRLFTVITIFLHFRLEHWLAIVFSYLNYQSVVSYGRCDNTVTRYAFVIFRTRYILVQIYIFAMSGFKFLMKKGSLGANSIFLVFVTEVSLSLSSNIKAGAEAWCRFSCFVFRHAIVNYMIIIVIIVTVRQI